MSRSQLMIMYFNKVAGARAMDINDIPLDVYLFLNNYTNAELAKPFIIQDIKNGKYIRRAARVYKVDRKKIARWCKATQQAI